MPDTVEHRVEMHRLAQQRRAAGKPVWAHTLDLADVFHNPDMTFEQIRDEVVCRLRASKWLKGRDESDPVSWPRRWTDASSTGHGTRSTTTPTTTGCG